MRRTENRLKFSAEGPIIATEEEQKKIFYGNQYRPPCPVDGDGESSYGGWPPIETMDLRMNFLLTMPLGQEKEQQLASESAIHHEIRKD